MKNTMNDINKFENTFVPETQIDEFTLTTDLHPDIVAGTICNEIMDVVMTEVGYDPDIDEMLSDGGRIHAYLVKRAVIVWGNNPEFAVKLKSDVGRDFLQEFMRHWSAGALQNIAPEIYAILPGGFSSGAQATLTNA